jgi:hypothetical protein
MVTIPLNVSEDLARRLLPVQDRLPDIIERGLRDLEAEGETSPSEASRPDILAALQSTGLVTVPDRAARSKPRVRHTPLSAGGPPASDLILAERRSA